MYDLGVPAPGTPPTVTPPPTYTVLNTTGPTAVGATVLQFAPGSLTNVLVGMYVVDLTDHRLTATANLPSAQNTTTLNFSSTGTAPNNIVPGMIVKCISNPAAVFPGCTVASVTATTVGGVVHHAGYRSVSWRQLPVR